MRHFVNNQEIKMKAELIKSILRAKSELIIANKNFETAEEGLVDYYSYQIKASKAKLDYLIKQVKANKMEVDMINNLEILLDETTAI